MSVLPCMLRRRGPAVGRRTILRSTFLAAFLALLAVWAVLLRPTYLGGPASYVMVTGGSMEPTLHQGDLVITRTAGRYGRGAVIAYHVPAGEPAAGSRVIHRVLAGDGVRGYVTQGDARTGADLWRPKQGDVIGEAWITIPRGGEVLNRLRSPLVLAALAGLFSVWVFLGTNVGRPREGA